MSGGCMCGQGITPNYRIYDYTVLIKLTIWTGRVRLGECFGVVAPVIVSTIVETLGEPMIVGRSPHQVAAIFDDMYDSGYFGGFWLVAMPGLDMALWDLQGKMLDLPVFFLLGGQRATKLPVYVSGLPESELHARTPLAQEWLNRGSSAVKFAAAEAHKGELTEIRALRSALGPEPQIRLEA